jgi:tetratricopeptide (TPR) repeat protein
MPERPSAAELRTSQKPSGAPAEEATLRARVDQARRSRDRKTEYETSVLLARWLARNDHDLDQAVLLATNALLVKDDRELRCELAAWLECLGDAARAAETLAPLATIEAPSLRADGSSAAREDAVGATMLLRIGVLSARAAEAGAASDAFARAAEVDVRDPLSCELRGSLAAWAPEVVSPEQAAEAYLDAAGRRERAGALDAQLENLWRAFDADPTSDRVASDLAAALVLRGRGGAADEAMRAHALALGEVRPEGAAAVHARRRFDAVANDDLPRALAAAIDERLDCEIDGAGGDAFDALLARAGLIEALAARLEVRAERAKAVDRARVLEELGRLFAGPLANPERAIEAFAAAMAVDPTRTEALVALRAHAAQKRDPGPLVEALTRTLATDVGGDYDREGSPRAAYDRDGSPRLADRGERAERTIGARIACARTLLQVAEEQLGDPALAAWAAERLLRLEPDDSQARVSLARAESRRGAARERLEAVRALVTETEATEAGEAGERSGRERTEALRALAIALRGAPLEGAARARVLAELAERLPEDRGLVAEAYRAAWARGDRAAVRALAERQLAAATEVWQRVEARRQLAIEARGRGAAAEANAATSPLLSEAPEHRLALSLAWVQAAIANDRATRARAIAAIAGSASIRARAAVKGAAATALFEAGDATAARKAAEQGEVMAPGDARCLVVLAETSEADAPAAYERAIAAMGPRASWCAALAEALERAGEHDYAVSWAQRLVSLRPGDLDATAALLRRAAHAHDAARLADALSWVLSQAQPAGSLAVHVAAALRKLAALDPERAAAVARRALDVFGPRHDLLREAMIEVAEEAKDDALGAALVERSLAIGAPTTDRGALHAELVRRSAKMGDRDGEARAIERAMRDGFDVRGFEANLDSLAEAKLGPDGEIAFLEARAALAIAKGETALAGATLRQLGASLWELARDRAGASRAFVRSAVLTGNAPALGADLARFRDPAFARGVLLERLAQETIPARAGALAAEAARAAFALGDATGAFDLASRALALNPSLADALEIAERGSVSAGRSPEMSPLYEAVGDRALGRFGRRAAHYRAARFFEQRGVPDLALKHAAEAFAAVPSEGATFVLLARAAERASDRAAAIRTIEQIAQESRHAAKRSAWLLRAATIVGADEEGLRKRVDLLLRAVLASPDVATIALLADSARALLDALPEEREGVTIRLGRAAHKASEIVEGPDGARVALAFAGVLVDVLADVEDAGELLLRALTTNAEIDEFARLIPYAVKFGASESAGALLNGTLAICDAPFANVGAPAWRLIGLIAEAAGDRAIHARAAVSAAVREPDDDVLVHAADTAVRGSDEVGLVERLSKRVPPARRVEALVRHGRSLVGEGAGALAIEPFERALDLLDSLPTPKTGVPDEERAALESELRAVYEAAGRGDRLEERALRAASDPRLSAEERAVRWAELALEREKKGDLAGAASAYFESAVLAPDSLERWSALERVAADARRHDLRTHALEEIARRVPADSRIDVVRRLARAYEEAADPAAAERAWQEVWDADPDDEEAERAIESIIVGRGDYVALAAHLGRRAERLALRGGSRESLRAVRLRRAVILEQRLNQPAEAAEELALLLTEFPDNESALSYLADLYERMGLNEKAAPLWVRLAGAALESSRQVELELRAAGASRAAGDFRTAMAHVRRIATKEPGHREAAVMRVEIARTMGDEAELGGALDHLATIADDAAARADLLVEAAQAAARAQDVGTAFARAQRAARIAPNRPSSQLYARGLEYRVRGAGSPDDARATIEELGKIEGPLIPDDAALQAFLLAEAFDAVQGGGAGYHRLIVAERQLGLHPVVSLGIAERLVSQWKFAEAVPHFKRALEGDLLGLRRRGSVALAGADAALRVEDRTAAETFLEVAAAEPDARGTALRKLAAIVTSQGDVGRSRAVLLELARGAGQEDRARTLAQLARILLATGSSEDRTEAFSVLDEAVSSAPPDSVVRAQLENEIGTLRSRSSYPRPIPLVNPRVDSQRQPPVDFVRLEREVASAQTPGKRASAQLAIARGHIESGALAAAETMLWEAFGEGSAEAGELLISLIARDKTRAADRLKVCRRLVDLFPGHVDRLDALRAAALADRNPVYARAIEHVLRAFDPGAGPLPPPSLVGQSEQPGMLAFLTRPSLDADLEPLSLTWESAHALFAKTPIAYAITGVERVTPGPSSPIARLYDATLRLLGVPRLPLFYRRSPEALAASVALTHPASALITGDGHEDTTDLRHCLGQSLTGALSSHVLLLGLPEEQARSVWQALLVSFGPADEARLVDREASRLAEQFWNTIPPRVQRRLKDLLAHAGGQDFDDFLAAARQSARRVGLFIAGDFGFAARKFLADRKVDPQSAAGDGLRVLCAEHAPLADLFRLAVSAEYADARWRPVAPNTQRHPSSGRARAVR